MFIFFKEESRYFIETVYLITSALLSTYISLSSSVTPQQGEWKCLASNDFGHSVTAASIKLVIPRHYKKPVFLEPLRAVLSQEGTVNLECKVCVKSTRCVSELKAYPGDQSVSKCVSCISECKDVS